MARNFKVIEPFTDALTDKHFVVGNAYPGVGTRPNDERLDMLVEEKFVEEQPNTEDLKAVIEDLQKRIDELTQVKEPLETKEPEKKPEKKK